MNFDFGFFIDSFSVIRFVFNSLFGVLGIAFNTIVYFCISIASVSVVASLGVSLAKSSSKSKKGGK